MAERILGGRYTVQDKIGTGGMAIVYRGLDNVLGRVVAIKTMLPQYAADPSFAARFKQEAQAAAALQSPYIVNVYDWGKDQDTYYIVMEYLRGTDLKSGIRKHGALTPRKVAQIGSQIAQALSVAHRHDIIHRDIKPQNIMVQPDGNIKVMDFGIARAKNSHLTADNSVLGTAHYVSPEQTQGHTLGPTSDIYSLGVVMYEAACGKVPFEGDDAISVALKQVNEIPVPPSQVNPAIDKALESIILKCMQKNPADRFQSARELSRTLREYLAGHYENVTDSTSIMGATPTAHMQKAQATQAIPHISARPTSTMRATEAAIAREEEQSSHKKKTGAIIFALIAAAAVLAAIFSGVFKAGNNTKTVPNFINLTKEVAIKQIEDSDFFKLGDIKEEYSPHVAAGKVIDQDPQVNSNVAKGTAINLIISKGEEPAAEVVVPDLSGLTPSAAQAELTKVGLKYAVGDSIFSDKFENGRVAQQDPKPNSKINEGDTVTYNLSKGKELVAVASVVGLDQVTATNTLQEAGFVVATTEDYSSTINQGLVISQDITGSQEKGTTITLVISKGPKPTPKPKPDPKPKPNPDPKPNPEPKPNPDPKPDPKPKPKPDEGQNNKPNNQ